MVDMTIGKNTNMLPANVAHRVRGEIDVRLVGNEYNLHARRRVVPVAYLRTLREELLDAEARSGTAAILVRFAVVARIQFKYMTHKVRAMVLRRPSEPVPAKIRDRFPKCVAECHISPLWADTVC